MSNYTVKDTGVHLAKGQAALPRPKTIGDLLYVDDHLEHLLAVPLVCQLMQELNSDFQRAYVHYLSQEISVNASEAEIEQLRLHMTGLFQAFVTGVIWTLNPDGRVGKRLLPGLQAEKKEEKRIIIP